MKRGRTDITKAVLQRLLVEDGLSYREAGRSLGCNASVVVRRSQRFGIRDIPEADSGDFDVHYDDGGQWAALIGGRRFAECAGAAADMGRGRLPPRPQMVSGCGNSGEMCAVDGGVEHEAPESVRVAQWYNEPRSRSTTPRYGGVDHGCTAGIDAHARRAA